MGAKEERERERMDRRWLKGKMGWKFCQTILKEGKLTNTTWSFGEVNCQHASYPKGQIDSDSYLIGG